MVLSKSNKKSKLLTILFLSIILFLAGYYLFKIVSMINIYGFKSVLNNYSTNAKYIYFIICFLQPIILPLPEPITIIGGSSVFGPLKGAGIGFLGTILGIIVMYFIARYTGRNIIERIIDEKKLEKFYNYVEKNETLILLLLFILPILPDEIICIGSGLAKINAYKFILVASIAKVITSISLSYSLTLLEFDWKFIFLSILIFSTFLFIKKNKSYDK